MGKFLKSVLVLAAVGGIGFGWIMQATAGMVDTTDGFFQALRQKDLATARSLLARETSQKLDDRSLRKLMADDSLAHYSEVSFPNREISAGVGEMRGTLKTTSGGVVPLHVVLVKEAGAWKLYRFQAGN